MTASQYMTTLRKAQHASTGYVQTASDAVRTALDTSAKALGQVEPAAAIERLFDVLDLNLQLQRETAKHLVGAGVSFGDTVRGHAAQAGVAVREQAEQAQDALRTQAASAQRAAYEQVVHLYEELTAPQLQHEPAGAEELREPLPDHDDK
jgi:hypothetical protein